MLNPVLTEMAARDRIAQMGRGRPNRSFVARDYPAIEDTHARVARPRRTPRANPQQALGWFLVSVGLRLALPRSRAGSTR
jgi:hypothetical protein